MADLLSTIMQSLGGDGIKQMSNSLGVDEGTTSKGVEAALPLLVSALARNSQTPDGAQSLHKALEKDHDGSILDNLGGLFANPASGNGAGILKHVLGGKRQNVEQGLSKTTGINTQASMRVSPSNLASAKQPDTATPVQKSANNGTR